MLQITLELKNTEDEKLLLPLLQRLGINYSALQKDEANDKDIDYHRRIIEQGIDMTDFNAFVQDFDNNRKDRNLPFRNE
jgi:hypothetical protein